MSSAAGPVPAEAQAYFRQKGWAVGFDYRDVWREEHAIAFTVAKATTFDVLSTIRFEVDRAIRDGQTFEQFKANLTPRLQQLGWWGEQVVTDPTTGRASIATLGSPRRLKTIYRANLRTARAAGQWDRAQRTKRALPFFLYQLGPSEVHRKEHVALEGTILPVDDPFWATHFPPNGWGCKCHLRQITRREAERRGGVSARPSVPQVTWRNKRTGRTEKLPKGIDPGWDTNPGLARAQAADSDLQAKAEEFNAAFPAKPVPTRKDGRIGPDSWPDSLNASERDAFYRWVEDSGPIRRYLRTGEGDPRTAQQAELITNALSRTRPRKQTVYRGLTDISPETVVRWLERKRLPDSAPSSVSSSRDAALRYASQPSQGTRVLIVHESRRAQDIRSLTLTGEEELIQPAGELDIVDVKREIHIVGDEQVETLTVYTREP